MEQATDSVVAALHTLRVEALTWRVLFWSSAVVPLLAAGVVWAVRQHRPRRARVRDAVATFTFVACSTFAALSFGSCFIGETGGDRGKRQLGRAVAAPVLVALERYHTVVGSYPDSLPQLIPVYLAAARLHPPQERLLNGPLSYNRDSIGFTLSFSYLGPGANTCAISPRRHWSCSGFY